MMLQEENALVALTAHIVRAHVSHNAVAMSDLSTLIAAVHAALAGLDAAAEPVASGSQSSPTSVGNSISPEHIVCLEDGKHMKSLKRHLMAGHQMTPADYRAKWKLPADYPMVASNYVLDQPALASSFGKRPGKGRTPKNVTAA